MAILNDLDRKITQLGQGALKKTKNVSESVRLSSAIKDEENKQLDIFRQIGAYYYRTYADQAEGQMKLWCESVRESQMIIAQYQDRLKILKGVAYCPNCNAEVPLTAAFCSNCGMKMAVTQSVDCGKVCPGCGQPVEEGQMYCTNCGSPIPQNPADITVPVETAPVEEVPVEEAPIEEAPVEPEPTPTVPVCPNCGKQLREGIIFCTNCGTKL